MCSTQVRSALRASKLAVVAAHQADDASIYTAAHIDALLAQAVGHRSDFETHGQGIAKQDAGTAAMIRRQPSNISGNHMVGASDAQTVYPPTACIFVAK